MLSNTGHGGVRRGAGRKIIEPDLIELEKLCALQCTHIEIAHFLRVSVRTVEKWEKNPVYAEVMNLGRTKGRLSIRRKQMQLLDSGNLAMAIHLGKVYLDQREITPIEVSGSKETPLKISLEVFDEIQKIARKNK